MNSFKVQEPVPGQVSHLEMLEDEPVDWQVSHLEVLEEPVGRRVAHFVCVTVCRIRPEAGFPVVELSYMLAVAHEDTDLRNLQRSSWAGE
jgi:hypothetical protein